MTIVDLFWIFFMISAMQPLLRQRMLEAARQRAIARFEKERGSRVILLVHRQETMSILGFPVMKYIDINDSEQVIRAIRMTDSDVPIDIIMHTPGGLVLAALQIARAVKAHPAKVTAFVPHHAMSGGTLIALASDEIVMDTHAVLGPVDPQMGQYPAASLLRVLKEKPIEKVDDKSIVMGDMAEKALRQMKENVIELLSGRYDEDKVEELATKLSQGTWTHDHPITCRDAEALGLPVREGMPDEVYQLMSLFPQPVRREPTVEFIPVPRRSEDRTRQG
jgi:ClpP class serine protease